jgi:hypothetical protein
MDRKRYQYYYATQPDAQAKDANGRNYLPAEDASESCFKIRTEHDFFFSY